MRTLKERAAAHKLSQAKRCKERYALAKSLGMPVTEATLVQGWSEKRIREYAEAEYGNTAKDVGHV